MNVSLQTSLSKIASGMRSNYTNARIVILLHRHVRVVKESVLLKLEPM